MNILKELSLILSNKNILVNEMMSKHTTFRIGGPADFFVMPETTEEVCKIIKLCKEKSIPYCIIGNGSNLLVGDKGYRGIVIQLYRNISEIRTEGTRIYADAGALLSKIAAVAHAEGLTGFEFAAGIPGTLGGAVMMNAGAYGGEMKQILERATVITEEGEVKTLSVDELELGYRTSVIAKKNYVVLEAVICLENGDKEDIRKYMDELKERRITKQPLEFPSAGSTFKRPEGNFAGKLIEDAGLRGFRIGGAQVSEKHCGFVINNKGATAKDVVELIKQVSDKVEQMSGIKLEPEVKMIGEF